MKTKDQSKWFRVFVGLDKSVWNTISYEYRHGSEHVPEQHVVNVGPFIAGLVEKNGN